MSPRSKIVRRVFLVDEHHVLDLRARLSGVAGDGIVLVAALTLIVRVVAAGKSVVGKHTTRVGLELLLVRRANDVDGADHAELRGAALADKVRPGPSATRVRYVERVSVRTDLHAGGPPAGRDVADHMTPFLFQPDHADRVDAGLRDIQRVLIGAQ